MNQMEWRLVHKELFITKMAAFALIIPLEIYDLGLSFFSFFFFWTTSSPGHSIFQTTCSSVAWAECGVTLTLSNECYGLNCIPPQFLC